MLGKHIAKLLNLSENQIQRVIYLENVNGPNYTVMVKFQKFQLRFSEIQIEYANLPLLPNLLYSARIKNTFSNVQYRWQPRPSNIVTVAVSCHLCIKLHLATCTVADPGFPRGHYLILGRQLPMQLCFVNLCVKTKESRPWGAPGAPLRSANDWLCYYGMVWVT